MRTFGASFTTEKNATSAFPFWSAIFHFPSGDVHLSSRFVVIGGNVYMPSVLSFGALESIAQPGAKQLDVQTLDVRISNIKGGLLSGGRFSDLLDDELATVLVDLYLNFEVAGGTIHQELMQTMVVQHPVPYDAGTCQVRLYSGLEKYLNASALRVINETQYPYIRPGDAGATVPLIIGNVKRAPGRITKARRVTTPRATSTNASRAQLLYAEPGLGLTSELWTVIMSQPETVEFTGAGNTDNRIGDSASSPRLVYAQSFSVAATQKLAGFLLDIRALMPVGEKYSVQLRLHVDNAGSPGSSKRLINREFSSSESAYALREFRLPSPYTLTAGAKYWVSLSAWGSRAGGYVEWKSASGGGYAGHNGKSGTYPASEDLSSKNFTWNSGRDAHDFRFRLLLEASAYAFGGSVTGADGTGAIGTDFTSTSGKIKIPARAWSGIPAGGDSFQFSTSTAANHAIFAESPTTTPNARTGQLYWGDEAIKNAASTPLYSVTTESGGLTVGGSPDQVLGQTFKFTSPYLLKSIEVKIKRTGSPAGDRVLVRVVEADAAGYLPAEAGATLLTGEILESAIGTSYAFHTVDFQDRPIVLKANKAYAVIISHPDADGDGVNFYTVARDTGDPFAGGNGFYSSSTKTWTRFSTSDLNLKINGGNWVAGDTTDGSGFTVTWAFFDVDVPDDIDLTLDIDGITDTTTGTYSGAESQLLTNPAHVIHHLLVRAGVPSGKIDIATSFADAAARYGKTYELHGVVQEQSTWKALILDLAFQSRALFDWSADKAVLRYRRTGTVVATLDLADIVDRDGLPALGVQPADTQKLVNRIELLFDRVPYLPRERDSYEQTYPLEDATSITKYGRLERPELFFCDFIRTPAMAADVAAFYLGELAWPKRRISATGVLPLIDIEKGDAIAFDIEFPGADVFDGLDGTESFVVEQIRLDPMTHEVELTTVEE